MRLGGRKSRVEIRQGDDWYNNPAPAGQHGGSYQPLSNDDMNRIIDTSMRLLSDLGIAEVPKIVLERAVELGGWINDHGRLSFSRSFVEDIISNAAKRFVFHGRDPSRSFEIGDDCVHYGTGGAAVQTLDMDTGLYRPSTLQDLYDFTRLVDTLQNVSWFTRCCVATDIHDILDLDVNTAFTLLKGTTKPVGTSFTVAESVDPIIDMFDLSLGGEGKYRETPFCKAHISPVISPLRYGEDAVAVTLACIRRGVPISCITAAQSGATAPAAPAGFLAQSLSETLASLILVNMFCQGYPMIFSNWPLVIDLRTGSFSGGGGEISVMNAASAQLSNFLGLPSGVACSMSDAKAIDAQMGSEKAMSALSVGLAGGNMIYESSGMTSSLLGASYEAFVLDDEMLGHIYRVIKGIDVNDETLGYDSICEAVLGDGHFLGTESTLSSMQRDYYYPHLADRDNPKTWNDNNAPDIWIKARKKAKEILKTHYPDYISSGVEKKIRNRYNILL